MQFIKDYLVRLGPNNTIVRAALRIHARRQGYQIDFANHHITLRKASSAMVLNKAQYVQVPVMIECYDLYFTTIKSESIDGRQVLNFSRPDLHQYINSGASFYFPSVPEDDVMDAYIHGYRPQSGDVVWDVGAHAGATSYFLAQMVGPSGKVYAFEPDESNYEYLIRNIELHGMKNIIPVKKALTNFTGSANFNMDGTMSAGLSEHLVYKDKRFFKTVSTISLRDACLELGEAPQFIKMDIEGAEIATIEGSQGFLRDHPIHFAIESNHRINGLQTCTLLEDLFSNIGYNVRSSNKFGQMFTWADPGI